MSYFTINEEKEFKFIEKKSEFIGRVKRIKSEEEAKEYIQSISKLEKGARHNVYAYTIGENSNIIRYSDDGEPSGTGGMPILNIITKNDIKDVVVVVTRYFGGILLGASGLTRAYSNAAKGAVDLAKKVEIVLGKKVIFTLPYDLHAKLKKSFEDDKLQIINEDYTEVVKVEILLINDSVESTIEKYNDLLNGKLIYEILDENQYFKDEENKLYDME